MTSDTMKVDWAQPLEAVHEDGRVMNAHIEDGTHPPEDMTYGIRRGDGRYMHVNANGTRYARGLEDGWTIRNKPAAAVAPAVAPEAPEKPAEAPLGVLTGVERVERLEALVGRLAKTQYYSAADQAEARALCPESEIDPDLLKAREIVMQVHIAGGYCNHDRTELDAGKLDNESPVQIALAGIKAGREMTHD